MSTDAPFESEAFRALQREYLRDLIAYLLEEGVEFAVAAEIEFVEFDPPLPEEIRRRFSPVSLFVLSGYTYETTRVEEDRLSFEAGFGEENIGSIVSMPLLAIKQLVVGDYPVAVNIAEPLPEERPDASRSMEALLNNPENIKLLKKRKKNP